VTVRVLLVDDVDVVRSLVRIALRHHGGFEVVGEADSGLAAVERASSLQPDLVLLDLGLPDLAGRDVLTRLRSVAPAAKVVVFTGAEGHDQAFYEQHAAGYVQKDAELGYLVGLLADLGRSADRDEVAEFEAEVSSVPLARDFVRTVLRAWSRDDLLDDASLVVTELASNAVLHAGSSYRVRLRSSEGVLRIEVADGDRGTPEPQPFSPTAESGRGIVMVSAVAASWGIDTVPGLGKTTWAELGPG
jgi:CheY-like chemotaxis protein